MQRSMLGNTKLYGFLYAPEAVFIPYWIAQSDTGLYAQNEERIFHVNSLLYEKTPHVIYTGQSNLEELIQSLWQQKPKIQKDHTDSFPLSAMQRFSCPVCFIPLGGGTTTAQNHDSTGVQRKAVPVFAG